MATVKFNDSSRVFQFLVNPKELNLMVITLPKIKLSGAEWTVKMCKKLTEDDDDDNGVLCIYLAFDFKRNGFGDAANIQWTCKASASIRLFHKSHAVDGSVVKHLPEKTFDDENSSHGIEAFIKWSDFLENHVKSEVAKFEIDIKTGPLRRQLINLYEMKQVSAEFHIEIENVSKLNSIFSPEVALQGVRWKVCCRKENDNFGVYIHGEGGDMDAYWIYGFNATVKILSYNGGDGFTKIIKDRLNYAATNWGKSSILKWSELIDPTKRYVLGDKAILTVTLKVDDPVPMW